MTDLRGLDLPGRTRRFELAHYEDDILKEHITAYVTVALLDGKPRVITFSGATMGSSDNANLAAVGKAATLALGADVPFEEVRKAMLGTYGGPAGWVVLDEGTGKATRVDSLLDAVAKWTEQRWWESAACPTCAEGEKG